MLMAKKKKKKAVIAEIVEEINEAIQNDEKLKKAFVHDIPQFTLYHGNSKYRHEYCQAVIDHMAKGNSLLSFAVSISVDPETPYSWMKQHDEFAKAYRIAKAAFQVFWERIAFHGITNQISFFDGKTFQFMMQGWFKFGIEDGQAADDIQRQTYEDAMAELEAEEQAKFDAKALPAPKPKPEPDDV